MSTPLYLAPGKIGRLQLDNRLVRAATSETMATADGAVTDELVAFYETLAKGGAGLLITGHIYVERRGQCSPRQMGLYSDALVPDLRRLTDAVHKHGGRIFAELSHAGSQVAMPEVAKPDVGMPELSPIAPSVVKNEIFGRDAAEMTESDIADVIAAFAGAGRRAAAPGFDGIHLHGGNGYLIAQFSSPHANRRSDAWGGDASRRHRFFLGVYDAVRAEVGPEFPISARLGVADSIPGGLDLAEGIERAALLAGRGIDALEVSYCAMSSYLENIRPFVGLSLWRGLQDWAIPRIWTAPADEAYYRSLRAPSKPQSNCR